MGWTDPSTRSTGYKVTSANWNELVNNMLYLAEVNYTEFTSDVTISATSVGTANQVVSAGSIVYTADPILIEFYCPKYIAGASTVNVILKDGSTVLGTVTQFTASSNEAPVLTGTRITPTAASHTYSIAAWSASASATMKAGSGGTSGDSGSFLPGWIRIMRCPT